ncbi:MAG: FAD-binding oxidoreductase [Actinobacteria bacterium]|nr:FAD-binding oxidoreductase [Actinomycetota bacterium]
MTQQLFAGWGGTAATWAESVRPAHEDALARLLTDGDGRVIVRGLGRSYGDAAQTAGGTVISLESLNAVSGWERGDAVVTCGAGVTLLDLINLAVPRGWFIPVSPGTAMVTVGGAIAADVHGKNHHNAGSFGSHVRRIRLMTADAVVHILEPGAPEFAATVGGMGLTGVILDADIQLMPVAGDSMSVTTVRTRDLETTLEELARADAARYSVAWLDVLARGAVFGRGIVTSGDHIEHKRPTAAAVLRRPKLAAPRRVPSGLLNRHTVSAFNSGWYHRAPRRREDEVQSMREFFHPLDSLDSWNRVYGRAGFVQYQFVVPEHRVDALRTILRRFADDSIASFLTVLKRFGPGNDSPLSFPIAGWTLAVDIPAGTPGLAGTLAWADEQVASAGGRVYLAKDSRMAPESLRAMYPRLDEFLHVREDMDPDGRFASDLSRRLRIS